MKYGLSMFGLGPIFRQDPEAFLRRVTSAGYGYMEPCIMEPQIPQLKDHFWTFAELEHFYPLLKSFGMEICSFHVYPRDISVERQIFAELAKKYAVKQLVIPCPQFESAEQGLEIASRLTWEAEKLFADSIELLLHNGKTDCEKWLEGISRYEWLLQHCGDAVKSQADAGWLLYGGTDPVAFLLRNRRRVRSLHYKDMESTSDGLTEIGVGRGLVDMAAYYACGKEMDLVHIVDQDGSRGDFLEDLDYVAQRFDQLSRM